MMKYHKRDSSRTLHSAGQWNENWILQLCERQQTAFSWHYTRDARIGQVEKGSIDHFTHTATTRNNYPRDAILTAPRPFTSSLTHNGR